jgi:hypothetical protein
VTELEILFGVLENPDQRKRSWFYFRTLDRTDMPQEVSAQFPAEEPSDDPALPAGRLRALKDRIRREMLKRVRKYTLSWDQDRSALSGLDELDRQVTADLWSDLDTETAEFLRQASKTWQEADARAVADFVAERTRGYVERPAHAAGIFPMSGQVDRMLQRWVSELAAHLGRPDPFEQPDKPQAVDPADSRHTKDAPGLTSEDIDQVFASLLGQAAARSRVVVLVDALNQYESTVRSQHVPGCRGSGPATPTSSPRPSPARPRPRLRKGPAAASCPCRRSRPRRPAT